MQRRPAVMLAVVVGNRPYWMVGVGVLGGRAPHAEGTVTEIKIKLIMYILAYDLKRQ